MTTPIRRFWIPATALSTLGWNEGDVELVQATDFDALREELETSRAAHHITAQVATAAEQRNAELVALLRETSDYLDGSTRNAVWCDSILHKKMRAAIKPNESGASE